MEKLRYMISDAAAAVNVETHVLRYWEEELELSVPRNEMGHRYYTKDNINEFLKIKELKEQGYQLKEIKNLLHGGVVPKEITSNQGITSEVRMEQFKELMNDIIGHAISLNNEELSQQIGTEVQERILKELNYLLREQDEAQEERYKKLDQAIRGKVKKSGLLPKLLKKPIHA